MADCELAAKLEKQMARNEGDENIQPCMKVFNPYTEFKEFSRKDIQSLEKTFKKYDFNNDKKLDLEELKFMMEKLQVPQTHLGLKDMIKQVDEDKDNKINFKEFLMIFRKAKNGELTKDSGLQQLYDQVMEIDVTETGVKGAKSFFEAQALKQSFSNNFEREIREEQEERRRMEEMKKKKRDEFMAKKSIFSN
ncbi:EF-hand domain-containing D2 [Brachionus plicatilis]|uniref:EF-hand domain-containing D2 n=1 Tax=Brachionus plicatilis TaxID=10195 RepID=A0A3M7Q6Z8_BRAPC|nr:EF-hand domain-containing D2 [Brachionus plicatilis]